MAQKADIFPPIDTYMEKSVMRRGSGLCGGLDGDA